MNVVEKKRLCFAAMAPGAAGDAARAKLGVKPETTIGGLYAMAQDAFDAMTEEYERVQRELMSRAIVGVAGLGDQILLRLLDDNAYRYHEIRRTPAPEEG